MWRRGWDLNPRRACTLAGFQDRCIQPLCHLSVGAEYKPNAAPVSRLQVASIIDHDANWRFAHGGQTLVQPATTAVRGEAVAVILLADHSQAQPLARRGTERCGAKFGLQHQPTAVNAHAIDQVVTIGYGARRAPAKHGAQGRRSPAHHGRGKLAVDPHVTGIIAPHPRLEAAVPEVSDDLYREGNPTFTDPQMQRLRVYADELEMATGDVLFCENTKPDLFIMLAGEAVLVERMEGFDEILARFDTPHRAIGELSLLTGQTVGFQLIASKPGRVLRIRRARLRELLAAETDVSDVIIRMLAARRSIVIELGAKRWRVLRLVGSKYSGRTLKLRDFLVRNRVPHRYLELEDEADACQAVLSRYGLKAEDGPFVIWRGEQVLQRPSTGELAELIGLTVDFDNENDFDLAVVGAGPAGLAAAVYGESEGLNTVLIESTALGGQAGMSSRIENFLGFPAGLSGQELATRAMVQALKFGATLALPCEVTRFERGDTGCFALGLSSGATIRARSVVIATGAAYRKLPLDRLEQYEGAGVYYAATETEARLCEQAEVVVVGGGNSAGQAALFLATRTAHVHLLIRGDDLRAKMSTYLVDRILASPAITLHANTEVAALAGEPRLQQVTLHNNHSGTSRTHAIGGVFVFIGAAPHSEWLAGVVATDEHGFIPAGQSVLDGGHAWPHPDRPPLYLETSCPGVFAVGDIRSRSIKRVASAVGEGSMAVKLVHEFLAEQGAESVG